MKILYNIFVFLLSIIFRIGSFFNSKLKKGYLGRKDSLKLILGKIYEKDNVIWMHAASLGEYEQGLPVLEKLKEKLPNYKIVITFFSPSGYENCVKKNTIADVICYLPLDNRKQISQFVKAVRPAMFFTVKYEYWYNLLAELKSVNCKTFVVSALFYPKQVFFKPYGKWFVKQLQQNIDCFFHQNEKSFLLAQKIGLSKGIITGDTRFDRVKQIKNNDNFVEFVSDFKMNKKLIVFGSSWEAEENIAKNILQNNLDCKIIIAPHDLKRVSVLINKFPQAVLYSGFNNDNASVFCQSPVLIIDCIGLLSKIYAYANISVVGGGFHDKGLHNILEAAVFGKPVLFGNHYKKNPEADALIGIGGAKSFSNEGELSDFVIQLYSNNKLIDEMSNKSQLFVEKQPNSTAIIVEEIMR
ncbi:MAG: 3-deoxy-D-manno-octulosonic acid transferase [Bacteroidetes bacterium]|nr:3-deoxy-D-manno-octulosonic acid transferase [Bacteroidota bacterium]